MDQTSPSAPVPLPETWVERLFARLAAYYGARFLDMWSATDPAQVKAVWAEELAGLTPADLKRGLHACRQRDWPPTLPEFLGLCRPRLEGEAGYHLAVTQLSRRLRGEADTWPAPEYYWAAQRVGAHDLLAGTWPQLRTRWSAALATAREEARAGTLPPIPPQRPALAGPPPDAHPRNRAALAGHLARARAILAGRLENPAAPPRGSP